MDYTMIIFMVVGFIAQMIDGALGMAYGVSSTSFLLSIGISPVVASASVHSAEMFISGVSGLCHWRFGNVDRKLIKSLLVPGMVGGAIGAYILTAVPGKMIKPFVSFYLIIVGLVIITKAVKRMREKTVSTKLIPIGAVGGFFDAIGGGGWGPFVTSTLVARGNNPRLTIGSVNLTEFFVTVTEALTFIAIIGLVEWQITVGLIAGGILAAPLAAYVCKKLPSRALMIIVGILIMALSIRTIYQALW